MNTEVIVNDYGELLALHRALLEARFNPYPRDRIIAGSPFTAAIAHRVLEAIVAHEIERGKKSVRESWAKWRDITPAREQWRAALQNASRTGRWWPKWSYEEKRSYARILLSPFVPTSENLELFIARVDEIFESHPAIGEETDGIEDQDERNNPRLMDERLQEDPRFQWLFRCVLDSEFGDTSNLSPKRLISSPTKLMIGHYLNDTGVYLVRFDERTDKSSDTHYDDLQSAFHQAELEFGIAKEDWEPLTEDEAR